MYADLSGNRKKQRIKSLCDNIRYVEFGTGIYSKSGNGRKDPWVYWSPRLGRWVFTRGNKPQPFFLPSVDRAKVFFANEMNKLGV